MILSARYPAGPGWWLGPDELWHPPPEPPEPPGTTHAVGELKRTWQGLHEWDGREWKLVHDAVVYTQPSPKRGDAKVRGTSWERVLSFTMIAVAVVLSVSRSFPVVEGSASCTTNQLGSAQWALACVPNLNTVYHYSYSWWSLSLTYNPILNPAVQNGKEVLFYLVALACVLWARLALKERTPMRRFVIAAFLITALVAAADIVNVAQLSTFTREWPQQSMCSYLTCEATVQHGAVALTVGLSAALVLLMALSLLAMRSDKDEEPVRQWSPVTH